MWMNEYEVDDAVIRFAHPDTPNLHEATLVLDRLMTWTNRNSDGWPYWQKPARAAKSLMALIQSVDRYDPVDVSAADVKRVMSPIKAFLTRQGVAHDEIFG